MRKLYWYISAYIKKHGLVLIASVLVAIVIFSFSISFIVQQFESKPRRYIGIIGQYSLQNLPRTIENQMSVGLTRIEDDDTVSPLLAERWTVEDAGTRYRFLLKENVEWQDGREVQPQDLEAAYNFSDVDVITTPNDVIFELPDEFVPFPSVVAQPVFRTITDRYLLFFSREMLIGIGEYELVDYAEHNNSLQELVIESDEEKLIYRFYLTEQEAITAFKRGEVDELPELTNPTELAEWSSVEVIPTIQYDQYVGVFFNTASPLFNKNVRQGLAYAMTKPTGETRAVSPINPNSWAYLEGGKSYARDVDRGVERLLAEIPPQPLTFELTTTQNFADRAEAIAAEWETFGQQAQAACQESDDVPDKNQCPNLAIDVNVRVTNFTDTNEFQVLLVASEIPADPDQYQLWHSEQPTNFTRYKNTRVDALLESGRTTPERSERRAIYQEFQQVFLEDVPVIPIEYLETFTITRN